MSSEKPPTPDENISQEEFTAIGEFMKNQLAQTAAAMDQITDVVNSSLAQLDEKLAEMELRIKQVQESREKK